MTRAQLVGKLRELNRRFGWVLRIALLIGVFDGLLEGAMYTQRLRLPVVEDEPYRDVPFTVTPPPSLSDLDQRGRVPRLAVANHNRTISAHSDTDLRIIKRLEQV